MFWRDFVNKWQLKQVAKPNTKILSSRPQFVFALAFNTTVAVDPVSKEWTESWCANSREATNAKFQEFLLDYNSLEDFVKKN